MLKAIFLLSCMSILLGLTGCASKRGASGPQVTYVTPGDSGGYQVVKCRLEWEKPLGEIARTDCQTSSMRQALH